MQRIGKVLLLSIVLGLVGPGASSTAEPWGAFQGFPFAYSYANPATCGQINSFNGCGYYYDSAMIFLDYLFWLGTAVVGVSVISVFWNRLTSSRRDASQPTIDETQLERLSHHSDLKRHRDIRVPWRRSCPG